MDALSSIGMVSSDAAALNALPAFASRLNSTAHIDAAAEDFEAMFATQLLQPMFETIQVNGMFGGGHGEEVMRSFLLQEYGKMIAKRGLLGIASQVKNEMLRAQEAAGKTRGAEALSGKAQAAYGLPVSKEVRDAAQR